MNIGDPDEYLHLKGTPMPGRWAAEGTCLGSDPNLFFPGKGVSTDTAKSVCVECSVKRECLEYSLENRIRFGVWGGLSDKERRPLRLAWHQGKRDREVA